MPLHLLALGCLTKRVVDVVDRGAAFRFDDEVDDRDGGGRYTQ